MRSPSSLLFALLLLAGCGGDATETSTGQEPIVESPAGPAGNGVTDATRLTVVFTNNVDGEIEPCG
jgi:hypothetical protein